MSTIRRSFGIRCCEKRLQTSVVSLLFPLYLIDGDWIVRRRFLSFFEVFFHIRICLRLNFVACSTLRFNVFQRQWKKETGSRRVFRRPLKHVSPRIFSSRPSARTTIAKLFSRLMFTHQIADAYHLPLSPPSSSVLPRYKIIVHIVLRHCTCLISSIVNGTFGVHSWDTFLDFKWESSLPRNLLQHDGQAENEERTQISRFDSEGFASFNHRSVSFSSRHCPLQNWRCFDQQQKWPIKVMAAVLSSRHSHWTSLFSLALPLDPWLE